MADQLAGRQQIALAIDEFTIQDDELPRLQFII